jgi:long-chain acyl-CoA synthetase
VSGNLADLLVGAADECPSRVALWFEGAPVDYADLERRSARVAGFLTHSGIQVGDRVGIVVPNSPSFVAVYYGVLRVGAIVVPLNPLLRGAEIEQRLTNAEATVLVGPAERAGELAPLAGRCGATLVDPGEAEAAEPVPELATRNGDDIAVLLYTSGTSGRAKGAELTHAGLRAVGHCLAAEVLHLAPDDVLLGSAPQSHILGMSGVMNPAIIARAAVALLPRFEADAVLDLMVSRGTNIFLGVPTMCIDLLRASAGAVEVPRLKIAHCGGAPMPPETLHAFEERFGCEVLEGYGLTETAGVVTAHLLGQPHKIGSVGPASSLAEVRIVDGSGGEAPLGEVGEVSVRSIGLMRGYWRDQVATEAAVDPEGWFATGDLGYLDEDGYLFLVDRKKDMILRGGYSVYPREVEDVVYEHPSVREAAVVGVPDATLGEEVVALIVAKDGASCDPDEVKEFVRSRVAAYAYPRHVLIVDELPRGPTGKILKREIDRDELLAALALR